MFYKYDSFIWVCLIAVSAALPRFVPRNASPSSTPLAPSQDPFYTAPAAFESALPGSILRMRPAPGNLTSVVGNCSSAYNILYRTTDCHYQPSWAVTTLYLPAIPSGSAAAFGSALLSYLVPYNSVDVDSSPSYSFYSAPFPEVALALGLGWFVNVPDFEGPLASNVASIEQAHATLDSIRAVLASNFGLSPDAPSALWGYSGGSVPGEWALEFQQQYAPELNISGAALGGLVPNTTSVFVSVGGTVWASHAISGVLGVLTQYPAAYDYLVSQLKTSGPYNKTGFLAIQHMSYPEAHVYYANQSMFDYFVNETAVLQAPLIKTALQRNGIMLYHGVPQSPMFIYKAIHDEVTVIAESDAYVARSCLLGADILYQRNTVGGHEDEFTNGDPGAFAWLQNLVNGSYAAEGQTSGCKTQNVTIDIVDTGL